MGSGLLFLGVVLGAFGAHGLEQVLEDNKRAETWETAVLYHLVHGLALLVMGLFPTPPRGVCISFIAGTLLFSGSLYVLSLTNITKLGIVTPFGGMAFLAGWGILVFRAGVLVKR